MSFKDVLRTAFPFLTAAAAAVPGGNIAVSALGQILKLNSGDDLDKAGVALLNATPEQRAQLQAEENRHAEVMKSIGIDSAEKFAEITAADRADARATEVKTGSWMPAVLAAASVVTLVFCVWLVAFRTLPPAGHDAVILLLGAVIATYKDVYGYVFGSSAGSDRKTELLAQAPAIEK